MEKIGLCKMIKIMRLSIFILFLSLSQTFAVNSYSQQAKLTLDMKNVRVEDVIDRIEKNSEFFFMYNKNLIDVDRRVDIQVEEKSVNVVLDKIFANTGITYSIKDRQILLINNNFQGEIKDSNTQQQKSVSGKVTDSSGAPLPGVSVAIKGTTTGVITDMDGKYTLAKVPENATLQFSFVGMKAQEIPVGNKININVALLEETIGLDEVVAVGYGSQKKKELTGSVAGIKEGELIKGSQVSPMGMIQGKIAGLNISKPNGGDPSSSYQFQLRGASSLTGNTSPLIIIDGIPQGDLSSIPQDDIESIDILKDGSAAGIYGTRGTNGVILVNTKRGKAGKTDVSYNGFISTSTIQNKLNLMNKSQFLANGGIDRGSETDWMDEITQTPINHSHNLAVSGGTKESNYRATLTYKKNEGIALKTGYDEIIGRFASSQSLFKNKIKLALDATYRRFNKRNETGSSDDYNAFKFAQSYNPTAPVYDANNAKWGGFYALDIQNYTNPVAYIMQRDKKTRGGTFQGSARLSWNIIGALKAQVFGSMKYTDQNVGRYESRQIFNTSDNGRASRSSSNQVNQTIETTLDYAVAFGKHNLVVLGGYSYEHNYREGFDVYNSNFDSDIFSYHNLGNGANLINNPTSGMMSSYINQDDLVSFFGRLNYNFDGKYLLSASLRHEGSTRLGEQYKWGTFPAFSAGWIINREKFMANLSKINELKLRFGYGVTGNMPSDNYLSLAMMGIAGRYYDHSTQKWMSAYGPTQNQNSNIKWEKKGEWNLGIDLVAFNNRFNFTFDTYIRKVSDLLYNYKVPTPPYLYSEMVANVGDATSKGFEFTLGGTAIKTKQFSWKSNVNFSFNTNRIDKFSNENFKTDWIEKGFLSSGDLGGMESTPLLRLVPGGKVGDFYMPVFEGFNADGTWKFKDVNKDGKFTYADDREFVGNAQPKFISGWTNEFAYGNFDLSISLRAIVGNKVYNVGRMALENKNVAGTEKNMLASVLNIPLKDAAKVSNYYLEDGSFLKVDNVTFGYNFPVKNSYISSMRLYMTGQNLFTFTKYSGIDPEVDTIGIDNMGIERTRFYPSTRSFLFGVNINF